MHQLLVEDLVSSPHLTPREGRIGLIDAPGLGVELDRDAVARAAERYRKGSLLVKVLIADQRLVTEVFPMEEAIPTMRAALTMLAQGEVVMPLRSYLALPGGDAVMGLMPSFVGGLEAVGVKVVAAFPANFGTEFDTHQGVVLFFDTQRGLLRAIVDATSITAIRTAAVSGLATDLLARPDAGDLAIIGAGTQAHTHLQAMRAVTARACGARVLGAGRERRGVRGA